MGFAIVQCDTMEVYELALEHPKSSEHLESQKMVRFDDATGAVALLGDMIEVEFEDENNIKVGNEGKTTPGAELLQFEE